MKIFKGSQRQTKLAQDILTKWDNEVTTEFLTEQKIRLSRRNFLAQSMSLVTAVAAPSIVSANNSLSSQWVTLSKVQEHLFPRTGNINNRDKNHVFSPGAKDINAIGYLHTMLHVADTNTDERDFILKGVGWLDGMANTISKSSFVKLNENDRERVLKKISESETGETWLSTLLRYIFEALLTDPVYGGNVNSLGWQWLEHQPGFPRPVENKKYWMLAQENRIEK